MRFKLRRIRILIENMNNIFVLSTYKVLLQKDVLKEPFLCRFSIKIVEVSDEALEFAEDFRFFLLNFNN
jgi:hypothetical protein